MSLLLRRSSTLGLFGFVALFLLVRLFVSWHHTIWTDEVWSIGTATGHSLQTLWKDSKPLLELGDYLNAPLPVPAAYYKEYLGFDSRCKLPEAIVRACLRGDWHSPLYYFMLWPWMKIFGTGEFSARMMSVLFSLGAVPFIWMVAKSLGGRNAAIFSSLFFALAPASIFYSFDVRVYALSIFLSAALVWLTFRLTSGENTRQNLYVILWTLVAGTGLLSLILFLGAYVPCVLWLLLHRRLLTIRQLLLMILGSGAIGLLWQVTIPYIFCMNNSPMYLTSPMPWLFIPSRPISHVLGFFASCCIPITVPNSVFGVVLTMAALPLIPVVLPAFKEQSRNRILMITVLWTFLLSGAIELIIVSGDYPKDQQWRVYGIALLVSVVLTAAGYLFARKKNYGVIENFDDRVNLLYLNVICAIVLPTLFDLAKSAHTAINHRYSLGAIPAAFILAGFALSKCRPIARVIVGVLALCLWLPIYGQFAFSEGVMGEDYKAMARIVSDAKDSDVVIITGTFPTIVPAVAHYLPDDRLILGRFDEHPDKRSLSDVNDVLQIMKGKTGVYLVKTYWTTAYSAIEELLRQNARLEKTYVLNEVPEKQWSFRESVFHFVPKQGAVFE